MVRKKKSEKVLFPYLDLPRIGERELISDMYQMTLEFMKYQGEVAYETSKIQAITIASTASSIGVGWSAFFFGAVQEDWLMVIFGLTMSFAGATILGYYAPRRMDRLRESLDNLGAVKFYKKWLSDFVKSEVAQGFGQKQSKPSEEVDSTDKIEDPQRVEKKKDA